MKNIGLALSCAMFACGCLGTTGSDLVTFEAAAAGPEDALSGSLQFSSGAYQVELTRAELHVGAIYLDQSLPVSGAQATSCVLPGVYVAEVTHGLDVDLLSSAPQRFPSRGVGLASPSRVGEVWLTHGDVDATNDSEPVFTAEGTARRAGEVFPFRASISIGANRLVQNSDASQPGARPICKERIVSPIPAELVPAASGALLLRIDPRILFEGIDFASLPKVTESPPLYQFSDAPMGSASIRLYQTLRSARSDLYRFDWITNL